MKQTNQPVQQAAATLYALAPEVAAHGTGRVRCLCMLVGLTVRLLSCLNGAFVRRSHQNASCDIQISTDVWFYPYTAMSSLVVV
jgi:hypothetical protein